MPINSNEELLLLTREALDLLRANQEHIQGVVAMLKDLAMDGRGARFMDPLPAQSLTGLSRRQLETYRKSGLFRHGKEYRDIRNPGDRLGRYQYCPDAINRRLALPPEQRRAG